MARRLIRNRRDNLLVQNVHREHILRLRIRQLGLVLQIRVDKTRGGVGEAVRLREQSTGVSRIVHVGAHLGGQNLAQLDSPLVEGVDTPYETLHGA